MTRAEETTQVDYSLLDDAQLGDVIAEKVLGATKVGNFRWHWRDGKRQWDARNDAFVSWWGAGLVIDKLFAEDEHGMVIYIAVNDGMYTGEIDAPGRDPRGGALIEGADDDRSPVRAFLIAALQLYDAIRFRAKEVEA